MAQEEVKRIQSVPLVIGQFMKMVNQNNGLVGSTMGSDYYVRILSTINRKLLNPRLRCLFTDTPMLLSTYCLPRPIPVFLCFTSLRCPMLLRIIRLSVTQESFSRIGIDEDGIVEILGHLNASQRKKIRETYQQLYNESSLMLLILNFLVIFRVCSLLCFHYYFMKSSFYCIHHRCLVDRIKNVKFASNFQRVAIEIFAANP